MNDQILIDLTAIRKEVAEFHKSVSLVSNEVGKVEELVKQKTHELTEKVIRLEEKINKLQKEQENGKVSTSGNDQKSKGKRKTVREPSSDLKQG